jgi:GNAT superfamily N-acetyltransferase
VDGWRTTYAGILPEGFLASFTYDGHEAGTRQHLENLPAASAVFVATAPDRSVLGVAHVRDAAAGPGSSPAELDAIYVLPVAQRQRIGSRLFLTAVRWLMEHGDRSMVVWVLRDNPYRSFYDRLGGELLTERRQDDFGGVHVTSVAYGWQDLDGLRATLEERIDGPA